MFTNLNTIQKKFLRLSKIVNTSGWSNINDYKRMKHVYAPVNLAIIVSDYGLQLVRCRVIIWTKYCIILNQARGNEFPRTLNQSTTIRTFGCHDCSASTRQLIDQCGSNFKSVISEHMVRLKLISCEITLWWMPRNTLMINPHWFRWWPGDARQ